MRTLHETNKTKNIQSTKKQKISMECKKKQNDFDGTGSNKQIKVNTMQ
jgi:hypothetical protein